MGPCATITLPITDHRARSPDPTMAAQTPESTKHSKKHKRISTGGEGAPNKRSRSDCEPDIDQIGADLSHWVRKKMLSKTPDPQWIENKPIWDQVRQDEKRLRDSALGDRFVR